MKTDRELLELAAKAAGIEWNGIYLDANDDFTGLKVKWGHAETLGFTKIGAKWNPLTDDGDALRLAVNLRLEVDIRPRTVVVSDNELLIELSREYMGADPDETTRRAIVSGAAAIGEEMP